MLSQLPEQADPRRLCEQGKRYQGSVALRNFPRLAPLLTSHEGEAAFTLEFDRDAERRLRIRGQVSAKLVLRCQRCLGDMSLSVDAHFQLSPVGGLQEAERLPDEYDPLLLEAPLLHPLDLVEDELILAIPPAPRHSEAQCLVDVASYRNEQAEAAQPDDAKENPFAVLASLKNDNTE